MNWKKDVAAIALLFGFVSPPATAEIFQFSTEFSGSGGTCANTVCATLEVTQDGSDVDFVLTADLESGEKITGLYGNQDPYSLGTDNAGGTSVINGFGGTSGASATADTGLNAFKADGDGWFDWLIDIDPNDALLNGDTLTWTITDTTLAEIINAESVNGTPGKDAFTFALRVQGLATGSGSGWFFATTEREPPEEVSEPGMLTLLGIALSMLGFVRRRRTWIA